MHVAWSEPARRAIGLGVLLLGTRLASAGPAVQRLGDGVALRVGERRLEVRVCRDSMVRVVYGPPGAYFSRSSLMTVPGACSQTAFEVKTSRESVFVTTSRLSARIALSRGEVSWTGTSQDGGRRIDAPAPYEALPVYVKAGSIVPMGPEVQYTAEKPADPLTVWVYTGQDASFELYEDDGVSYEYEKGAFSTIPMRWDERAGALTLGECTGSFPGMLRTREVRVVFVSKGAAVPHSATPSAARTVRYDGRPVVLEARP